MFLDFLNQSLILFIQYSDFCGVQECHLESAVFPSQRKAYKWNNIGTLSCEVEYTHSYDADFRRFSISSYNNNSTSIFHFYVMLYISKIKISHIDAPFSWIVYLKFFILPKNYYRCVCAMIKGSSSFNIELNVT